MLFRSSERLNGLYLLLTGYANIAASLSGKQWNEGDVSCSVVRRVIIPDSIFALDGLLNTFIVILRDFQINEKKIREEIEEELINLYSSAFVMLLAKKGIGREDSHKMIKTSIELSDKNVEIFNNKIMLQSEGKISKSDIKKMMAKVDDISSNSKNICVAM